MRAWVDVAAEMEALLSLATYSFEHPADPFPDFVEDSSGTFIGEALGHPLVPDARCVRNSVHLYKDTRVMLVSGSNMSGKSTLLRTIGVNTVLAMAGARSEEHTSELQSQSNLVCRLLLEKKKKKTTS